MTIRPGTLLDPLAPTAGHDPVVHQGDQPAGAKETVTSLFIAFTLAMVFRGFVLEPFLIPTGSMAPTLLGAHVRMNDRETGYRWTVGPWQTDRTGQIPMPQQKLEAVWNPMTQQPMATLDKPRLEPARGGDRIFVMKFVYPLLNPARWDVVVFRNPRKPEESYIKRLVGLPNEQLALVDGDVFSHPIGSSGTTDLPWDSGQWTIQRKPERAQRAMWQPVFDSTFTPPNPMRDGRRWFHPPFKAGGGNDPQWNLESARYTFTGTGATTLDWSPRAPEMIGNVAIPAFALTDWTPYNEINIAARVPFQSNRPIPQYPVSDLRVRLAVEPGAASGGVGTLLVARGHEFKLELVPTQTGTAPIYAARISMRPQATGAEPAAWQQLAEQALPAGVLLAGRVTNLEFWHADQSLKIYAEGKIVAEANYDWTPRQRLEAAMGRAFEEIVDTSGASTSRVADPLSYRAPAVRLLFGGGPFTLRSVAIDRDIFYQPNPRNVDGVWIPGRGSHPSTVATLKADQFFFCGDNSPASDDCRYWSGPDGWVEHQIGPDSGVVHRDLLTGKAFCVFLPSIGRAAGTGLPVPNLGDVRWIW